MQFGFSPPVSGPLSSPDNLARIAVEGEAIGYDYATISDHVVIPRDIEAKYPYSDTGEFPGRSRGDRHEQSALRVYVVLRLARERDSARLGRLARVLCLSALDQREYEQRE